MNAAVRVLAIALACSTVGSAYYHFVRYTNRTSPYQFQYEKFDLNALPGRTLTYFIDDASGVQLAQGDSFNSLVSQIRAATRTWNDVETSEMRLAFGGITPNGSQSATPSLDILFEEVPPGLVAMGGPTIRAASNGLFVPIVKSVVIMQPDLRSRGSHTEAFFATMVHEIGHALGLQHTLTSSVMSQRETRSISRAKPLTTDDAAAISILYPRATFFQTTGTITGRVVTTTGAPVVLASVVAIAPNGAAVSTLTHPDGTYRLEGLSQRNYYVYVHPLPPPPLGRTTPADITYPLDPDGKAIPASAPFETVFFSLQGGVKDAGAATPIGISAAHQVDNINFTVRPRTGYGMHSVETYAYPGNTAVKPPYLSPGMERPFVIAAGFGVTDGNGPVSGLTATVLGGPALAIRPLSTAPTSYIQMDFNPQALLVSSDSARHVVFSANNDIYVLPSAFFHVGSPAPQIQNIVSNGTNAVVTGFSVNQDTRILFDGVQAPVRAFELVPGVGARLTVTPPPAAPGHRAVVTALNSDGQSSLFLQGEAPPIYQYPGDPASPVLTAFAVSPSTIPAGAEAVLTIDGVNMQFTEGQVSVGFGTGDVVARRIFVLSPTRILVNVSVSPSAQPAALNVTVTSGLQTITQPMALATLVLPARPYWLSTNYFNPGNGGAAISPGGLITIGAGALPQGVLQTNTLAVVNDTRVPLVALNGNAITFLIPPATAVGVATIRLETLAESSLPIAIPIDPAPPRIASATVTPLASGTTVSQAIMVDLVNLTARPSTLTATLGGRELRMLQLFQETDRFRVLFEFPADIARGVDLPLVATVDGRVSDPFSLRIAP